MAPKNDLTYISFNIISTSFVYCSPIYLNNRFYYTLVLRHSDRWLSSTLSGHRDGATLTDSGVRSGGSMQGIPSPGKMFTDWTKVKAEPPLSDTGTMEAMSLLAQASKFCFGSRDSVSGRRVLKVRRSGSETLVML
jgi:hypothetical protein